MIQDQTTKVIYVGNGQTTHFPFKFKYNDKAHIHVAIYDIDTQVQTELTKDFFVDSEKNEVIYPGYQSGQEPPEAQIPSVLQANQKLVIYRQTPLTQEIDFGSKYPLPFVEKGTDKNTLMIQEIKEEVGRCVKSPIGQGVDNLDMQELENRLVQAIDAKDEAKIQAQNSLNSALKAEAIKNQTQNIADKAVEQTQNIANDAIEKTQNSVTQASDYAHQAQESAQAISPEAYSPDKIYNFPDVVAYIDGETYRCIGQNVQGENPNTSPNWVRIAGIKDDFWDIDEYGNLMPALNPIYSPTFELDSEGNIMPREM